MKVDVAVLGSPSRIVLMVSVDVKSNAKKVTPTWSRWTQAMLLVSCISTLRNCTFISFLLCNIGTVLVEMISIQPSHVRARAGTHTHARARAQTRTHTYTQARARAHTHTPAHARCVVQDSARKVDHNYSVSAKFWLNYSINETKFKLPVWLVYNLGYIN